MESGVSGKVLDVIEVNAKSSVRKFSTQGEESIEFVTMCAVEKTLSTNCPVPFVILQYEQMCEAGSNKTG